MTDNAAQPLVLGSALVDRALFDTTFMEQLPEFRTLHPQLKTMRVKLNSRRGCSGCNKRRVVRNMYPPFMGIVTTLSPDGLARLKRYFGTTRLMYNTRNPDGQGVRTVVV